MHALLSITYHKLAVEQVNVDFAVVDAATPATTFADKLTFYKSINSQAHENTVVFIVFAIPTLICHFSTAFTY